MTTRTDPEKHREQVRAANRARHRATRSLIAKYRSEWDQLYAKEAAKEGVEPKPRDTPEIARLRAQIEQLGRKLDEARGKQGKPRPRSGKTS
jgi:predicted aminopeptidase